MVGSENIPVTYQASRGSMGRRTVSLFVPIANFEDGTASSLTDIVTCVHIQVKCRFLVQKGNTPPNFSNFLSTLCRSITQQPLQSSCYVLVSTQQHFFYYTIKEDGQPNNRKARRQAQEAARKAKDHKKWPQSGEHSSTNIPSPGPTPRATQQRIHPHRRRHTRLHPQRPKKATLSAHRHPPA